MIMIPMLKEKLQTSDKNYWKKNAIYLLLLISNIVLLLGLFNYYSKVGISIRLAHLDDISAILASIMILGYVSTRLPKIKELGDSQIYGISYFIIMCVIGLMTSYFNGKVNTSAHFGSYLEMFEILCGVLIFVILATKLNAFKEILQGKFTRKNQLICLIVFSLVGLFASYAHVTTNGLPANVRCMIVMISGLFGGPVVGIPVGIISGAYRYTLGGTTALPCAISTVISGIVGSLIFIWNDKKFPRTIEALILVFLFTGFEMLIIVMLTPPDISFPFVRNIYPIMLFGSVAGMLLFKIVTREAEEKMNPPLSYEKQKIKELESELAEHDEKIEELKNEIEMLKKDKNV